MRIAITGASGSVSTALLRRLQQGLPSGDVDVVGIARRVPQVDPAGESPYAGVQWESLDIAGPDAVSRMTELFRGVDAVVHTAWLIQPMRDPAELSRVNLGGTRNVVRAVLQAGVPHLVHLSSLGAYAEHPADDSRVDESWPATGLPTVQYSREKATCEAHLDVVEAEHPELVVTRVRPALVMQGRSGSELARYFAGLLTPTRLLGRVPLPVLPLPKGVRFQVVHAEDLADAIARMLEHTPRGAFNVADEPVLGGRDLGRVLRAGRLVPVGHRLARLAVQASYHARVHPVQPGWFDMGMGVPLLDTSRVREELGWRPAHAAQDVLAEVFAGMRDHAGTDSPALRPRSLTPTARTGT
ncbi:NAD-dependent epimerase/dehydratase family protein [Kineococcus sp. SYSU DK006]|uniref:NAD-dependent epimerase/dehydratase family protein n=1 Tax=Kineococcus sp. SYSU DK006 TaxID=3383127 RepID=UPI003D7DAC33